MVTSLVWQQNLHRRRAFRHNFPVCPLSLHFTFYFFFPFSLSDGVLYPTYPRHLQQPRLAFRAKVVTSFVVVPDWDMSQQEQPLNGSIPLAWGPPATAPHSPLLFSELPVIPTIAASYPSPKQSPVSVGDVFISDLSKADLWVPPTPKVSVPGSLLYLKNTALF